MRIGVTLPQTEIGSDPIVARDYAQAAEALGYDYINIYDHILGAQRDGWDRAYDYQSNFHEPFTLYAYFAAVTTRIEMVTGIIVLPQRETALVAKQAAEVDILSNGRLRLGVAIGWNDAEFEALGFNFHNRGRRIEEQIEVMRALWTQDVVTFEGKYHHIDRMALKPRPSREIPIWYGGMSDAAMRRAARIADGWFPQIRGDSSNGKEVIERFSAYVREYGRNPDDIGIQTTFPFGGGPDEWRAHVQRAESWGATHLSINTMDIGLEGPRAHIAKIEEIAKVVR
jgi:probable F420-dependent oxidoreductase